jgi:acetyltransferase-like isoleucine patch superfamily enzyme
MNRLSIVIKSAVREIAEFIEFILKDFPGQSGFFLRWVYYRCRLKHLGRGVLIGPGCRIKGCRYISIDDESVLALGCTLIAGPIDKNSSKAEYKDKDNRHFEYESGHIVIGKQVYLSKNCYLIGNGGIQIGDFCTLTPNVALLSLTNHYASFTNPSDRAIGGAHENPERQCYTRGPIVLGKNCFIAMNSILLPGASILEDSCVLMNSVVSGMCVGPNDVVAGNRAVFIKKRYFYEAQR